MGGRGEKAKRGAEETARDELMDKGRRFTRTPPKWETIHTRRRQKVKRRKKNYHEVSH